MTAPDQRPTDPAAAPPQPEPARVVLIGANGHGRSHRRVIGQLQASGAAELVGVCDLAPVHSEPDAPVPSTAGRFTDHRELLAATGPDVAVICTPPHTHLPIATDAARAGADLLLEKPPVTDLAEHAALTAVLTATGRACQVGFQALGSAALAELTAALTTGRWGRVTGISAVGAWQRPDAYYRRAPWAGRRQVDGRQVLDGALANPFAHALMQCLAIAEAIGGAPPIVTGVELERYRSRPIEVDDTAVVRARLDGGPPIVVAVTLCGDEHLAGDVIVHTDRGRAVLGYTTDVLWLPDEPAPRAPAARTDLLANLLAHRAARAPLLVPLARTAPFTALISAVVAAPPPHLIEERFTAGHGEGPDRVLTVPGISTVLRQAADRLALPSELTAPWASAPHVDCNISAYPDR